MQWTAKIPHSGRPEERSSESQIGGRLRAQGCAVDVINVSLAPLSLGCEAWK